VSYCGAERRILVTSGVGSVYLTRVAPRVFKLVPYGASLFVYVERL